MTNNFSEAFFQHLCDERTEPTIIVKADSPKFEIVAYNTQFYIVSGISRKNVVGISMSEIHAWSNTNEEGAIQIHDALNEVISTKAIVRLPAVRYDLPAEDGTGFTPSWWQPTYKPIFGEQENVEYILCTIIQLQPDEIGTNN